MAEKKSSGHTKSPSNREQTTANCGGMPTKKSVEERFASNQPPKTPPSEPITGKGG